VAGMQKVETPVGEADAQALPAPVVEPILERGAVVENLLLGRKRGGRQDARSQLSHRYGRDAALADTTEAAALAVRMAVLAVSSDRQHHGECCRDSVARARHVAHSHRIGRHVDRRTAALEQHHAIFAQRHQDSLAIDRGNQSGGRRLELGAAADRLVRRLG